MSFKKQDLERLLKLERQLPQKLPIPKTSKKNEQAFIQSQHPIETEENPQALFKELIKASNDGQVPSHLISRLKEIETKEESSKSSSLNIKENTSNPFSKKKGAPIQKNGEESLYTSFQRLLLEEEHDEI